jgi:hypothetical protein
MAKATVAEWRAAEIAEVAEPGTTETGEFGPWEPARLALAPLLRASLLPVHGRTAFAAVSRAPKVALFSDAGLS